MKYFIFRNQDGFITKKEMAQVAKRLSQNQVVSPPSEVVSSPWKENNLKIWMNENDSYFSNFPAKTGIEWTTRWVINWAEVIDK